MREKSSVHIYSAILGNCFDVKLTTVDWGEEFSWSLSTCTSKHNNYDDPYSDNTEYVEKCCLDAGVYTLKCMDEGYDGWYPGFINVQGKKYCDNFNDGNEEVVEVTIGTGKYLFIEILRYSP